MAQVIQGNFYDLEKGEGIPFGNVVIADNQTQGTSTDIDGNFQLEVPSLDTPIIFSSIGYGQTNFKADDLNFKSTPISMKSYALSPVVIRSKKYLPYVMYGGGGLMLTLGLVKKNKALIFNGVALALIYTSYKMYMKYRYKLGK
jgi:hypothetical protein